MRPLIPGLFAVCLVAAGLPACEKPSSGPSPAPSPPPGTTITGRERIGWDQQAPSAADLAAYSFVLYVDNQPATLASACEGLTGAPPAAACSAPLPPLTSGQHTLELAARVQRDGAQLESARSAPLVVTVAAGRSTGTAASRSTPRNDGAARPLRLLADDRVGGAASDYATDATRGDATVPRPASLVTEDGNAFVIETVATGLDTPSALGLAPDGRLFIVEASGRVRIARNGAALGQPAATLADADRDLGADACTLTVDPDFARTRFVYLGYVALDADGRRLGRIVRFREMGNLLGEPAVILDDLPVDRWAPRVRIGPDALLYVAVADVVPSEAEDLGAYAGKLLRLTPSGSVPADNPFRSSPVFAFGHGGRFDFDWDPTTGVLWHVEPVATGVRLGRTRAGQRAAQAVVLKGVRGRTAAFHAGAEPGPLRGDLFIASPDNECLYRVRGLSSSQEDVTVETLLANRLGRITAVVSGPDALYVAAGARVLRITRGRE